MSSQKNFPLSLPILLLTLALLLAGVVALARTPQPPAAAWPPFVMVYREYRYPNGYPDDPAAPLQYNTWQLDYRHAQDWKLTLLDSTYQPYAIGDWYSYDGKTYRAYSKTLNILDETPEPGGVTPTDWLAPGLMPPCPPPATPCSPRQMARPATAWSPPTSPAGRAAPPAPAKKPPTPTPANTCSTPTASPWK